MTDPSRLLPIAAMKWYEDECGHCTRCGSRREIRYSQRGYHERTGTPRVEAYARCQQSRWWNRHDDWRRIIPPPPPQAPPRPTSRPA